MYDLGLGIQILVSSIRNTKEQRPLAFYVAITSLVSKQPGTLSQDWTRQAAMDKQAAMDEAGCNVAATHLF